MGPHGPFWTLRLWLWLPALWLAVAVVVAGCRLLLALGASGFRAGDQKGAPVGEEMVRVWSWGVPER